MNVEKERWYWIRLKFGTTPMLARPHTINAESVVTWWSVPWYSMSPLRGSDYVIISEVQFPEGYGKAR